MSSLGSLNSLPNLPSEPSLDLGPLKQRKLILEGERPLWKRDQENILYATNRISNVPSYVPRLSNIDQTNPYENYTVPTDSEIEATLSPRDKFFRALAKPPAYRTRKKALNAEHRIIHNRERSPRLCYSTVTQESQANYTEGSGGATEKIEKERMGYNMIEKAQRVNKFRVKRRKALEAAAARNEPFAIKRLNTYRPKAPAARQEIKLSNRASRTGRGQTETRGNSNRDWSANSEWVKYVPTGEESDDSYVNRECQRFDTFIDCNKQSFSPRSYEATKQEEKYATQLLKDCNDRRLKRIFRNYKPQFTGSTYRPTYLIKLASDIYAKRLVAERTDSKPVEVSWKVYSELDVIRHMNKKPHFKQVYQKSTATNFLRKEVERQCFEDDD